MDLSAYSLQKLHREKRERQPNWTESEKQLLLSLTRIHQTVLENKGSDTMTIKRKSEAWDEIALRMKAAGFNRSKERLKQQLGRIRAAEAKRIKDALEKHLPIENSQILNDSTNEPTIEDTIEFKKLHFNVEIAHSNNSKSLAAPLALQELCIKSEERCIDEKNYSEQELLINSSTNRNINYASMSTCKEKYERYSEKVGDFHFKLQNVQSLAVNNSSVDEHISKGCYKEEKRTCATDVTSSMPTSTVSSNRNATAIRFASNQNVRRNDENVPSETKCQRQNQSKPHLFNVRSNRMRASLNREQSLRQLYMYRAAVERERLRSLRLQRKRDRILYRKDIEIQNLKLQILRNLTNQNRESSSINL